MKSKNRFQRIELALCLMLLIFIFTGCVEVEEAKPPKEVEPTKVPILPEEITEKLVAEVEKKVPLIDCEQVYGDSKINLEEGAVLVVDYDDWQTALATQALARFVPVLLLNKSDSYGVDLFIETYPNAKRIDVKSPIETLAFWDRANLIVVVSNSSNYSNSLYAAALASRCGIPLLFSISDARKAQENLNNATIIFVEGEAEGALNISIADVEEILTYNSDYMVIINSNDLNESKERFSLAAPSLVGGRKGFLLDIPSPTYDSVKELTSKFGKKYNPRYLAFVGSYITLPLVKFAGQNPWTGEDMYYEEMSKYADFDDDGYLDAAPGIITGYSLADVSALIQRSVWYGKIIRSKKVTIWAPYADSSNPSASEIQLPFDPVVEPNITKNLKIHERGTKFDKIIQDFVSTSIFIYQGHGTSTGIYDLTIENIPKIEQPTVYIVFACSTLLPFKKNLGLEVLHKGGVLWLGATTAAGTGGVPSLGIPSYDLPGAGITKFVLNGLVNRSVGQQYVKWKNNVVAYEKAFDMINLSQPVYYILGDPAIKPNFEFSTFSKAAISNNTFSISTPYRSVIRNIVIDAANFKKGDTVEIPYFVVDDYLLTTEYKSLYFIIWSNKTYNFVKVPSEFTTVSFRNAPCKADNSSCPYILIVRHVGPGFMPSSFEAEFGYAEPPKEITRKIFSEGAQRYREGDSGIFKNGHRIVIDKVDAYNKSALLTAYLSNETMIKQFYIKPNQRYYIVGGNNLTSIVTSHFEALGEEEDPRPSIWIAPTAVSLFRGDGTYELSFGSGIKTNSNYYVVVIGAGCFYRADKEECSVDFQILDSVGNIVENVTIKSEETVITSISKLEITTLRIKASEGIPISFHVKVAS